MNPERFFAGFLSLSGIYYAVFCVTAFPVFLPGFIVWGVWIAIALGAKRIEGRLFWCVSFFVNLVYAVVFFREVILPAKLHWIVAITGSLFWTFKSRLNREQRAQMP